MPETGHFETLTAADGHSLDCWMQPAEGRSRGGIVILQEIFGVTDQLKGVARTLAAQGFTVAIPALFDRRERNCVVPFDQGPRGREHMMALPVADTMADVGAAVDRLKRDGADVATLGFCWGGGLSLEAAQRFDLSGAVCFYGTQLQRYLTGSLRCPVLMHFGTKDDHVPPEMIAQVREKFPAVEMLHYEAGHAFANDARASFVPAAAEAAWAATGTFLDRVLP